MSYVGRFFFCAAALLGMLVAVRAQDLPSIWAGSYSEAQAVRGRTVVQNHCAECHQEDLMGGEGPALAGPTFMLKWETQSVERLFHKIRDTMPSRGSTEVSEQEKLDTVAFILQQNGFPAGPKELEVGPGLTEIRLIPKGGLTPPRAGAMVQVIGCLQESGGNQWTVARSTAPQMTTLDPMSATEKESAATAPAGAQIVQLVSVFPSPVALKGHRILVKGLLIKLPAGDRINVTQLESLSPSCEG